MQVNELYRLVEWIIANIEEKSVSEKYSALQSVLQNNVQQNQSAQSFNEEKKALLNTIKSLPTHTLSNSQIGVLNGVGIGLNIGPIGVEKINDIFVKNALDVANALSEIKSMNTSITSGLQWANALKPNLSQIVSEDFIEGTYEDELIIRVRFTREARIETIVDLKKWVEIWYNISLGISLSVNSSPDQVRVIGATNGSLITVLAGSIAFSKTLGSIMKDILTITEQFVDIRLKIEQLKQMKIDTQKAQVELQKNIDDAKKGIIDSIVIDVLGKEKKGETKGDVRNAFTKSTEKLVDFLDKGGEIDFVLPPTQELVEDDDEEENDGEEHLEEIKELTDLRETVKEIRHLTNSIRLLEDKSDEE